MRLREDSVGVHLNLAACCLEVEKDNEAKALYKRVLQLDEASLPALYNLAVLYEKEQDWPEAADCYQKLAEVTNSPEPLFRLGVALHKNGQWQEAASVYEKCVAHKPDWTQALLNCGIAYLRNNDHDKAAQAFQKVWNSILMT